MTQDQCLSTPTHYTYLGVCYVGNPNITISNPQNPQPPTVTSSVGVPEPGLFPLMAVALLVAYVGRLVTR